MCSKYTVTLDVWNEKQEFSSYFKVLCAFFFTTEFVIVIWLLKLFSDKCAFMHLKISIEIRKQQDVYHVLTLLWYPYRGFPFLLVCFKPG